jgi:uncharacterized repeat protein (TIGR03803 family)
MFMKSDNFSSASSAVRCKKPVFATADSKCELLYHCGCRLLGTFVLCMLSLCARADFPLTILATLNARSEGSDVVGLTPGADGNYYGVTHENGSNDTGAAFRMTPSGAVTMLVNFNATNGNASGPLIQASDGYLYGVEGFTVYRMTTNGDLTVLTVFNPTNGGSPPNYYAPNSPLVEGRDGNLYGTTPGGLGNLGGTVFQITPSGQVTTLISLTFTNGYLPTSGLVLGKDGNFYGTTSGRGGGGATVFKVTPEGALTTLFTFDVTDNDADTPGLLLGPDGSFYGNTIYGASHGSVMVFKVTPSGQLTTLARLTNGGVPLNLVLAKDGNFYGSMGYNTIFQMTTNGVFTTVISVPTGVVFLGAGNDGNLYGSTGTPAGLPLGEEIYRLTPPPTLEMVTKPGPNVTLSWAAAIGQNYQPQYAANLLSTNWISLGAPITATNLTITIPDAPGADTQRFYRVQLVP